MLLDFNVYPLKMLQTVSKCINFIYSKVLNMSDAACQFSSDSMAHFCGALTKRVHNTTDSVYDNIMTLFFFFLESTLETVVVLPVHSRV